MSTWGIAVLGAIAGLTIFLGLPFGRVRSSSTAWLVVSSATAIGVLLFLLWDVLGQAVEPVQRALLGAAVEGTDGWAHFAGLAAVAAVGITGGLMTLAFYERWMGRRSAAAARRYGPGTATAGELRESERFAMPTPGARLALLIAVGIGLHNFSEGLAIGQSAANGEIALALLLVVGFGLHNATEGFGIVGPLAGEAHRPSWGYLALLGLIGGGPTFLGTILGQSFVSEALSVGFLSLAAGSILYVVIQLLRAVEKFGRRELMYWSILVGLFLGFATDFIIVAAGA